MVDDDHEVKIRHNEDEVRVGTETASARSYMRHVLFDLDSSGYELEDLRRNNLEVNGLHRQEILGIEEPAAALQGREAIAAQHQEKRFIQEQHLYGGNSTPRPVPSHQQSIQFQEPTTALHTQEAIAALQGMPQQTR